MIVSVIRLTRPYYSMPLACGLFVIVDYVTAGRADATGATLATAIFALFCVLSGAYMLNDVCDIRYDAINAPRRPLPARQMSARTGRRIAVGFFAVGLAAASLTTGGFFVLLCGVAAGLAIYDLYSKRMGLFKNILAAALTAMLYPLAFTLAETVSSPRLPVLYLHPVWLFLTTLGYEMLKDIPDVRGDRLDGERRADVSERPAFLWCARGLLLAAALLTLLPYVFGWCRGIYLAGAVTAVALAAATLWLSPCGAIRCIYALVLIVTAASWVDLRVYGP